ncbi:MAG: hypothetical protein SAK29_21525 [Scytonema sp. PMC 1069.18]|nr:hypothetical protein [Scytonema sp. PMC 1069.18]MEC4882007.1 hypothetical protein [Scytonema sp. PMC 1070.18]
MSDEIYPGTCILIPKPGHDKRHLWIVLTEPNKILTEPNKDILQVVIVNVTTLREGSDTTVILTPGEHRFIRHESVIYYNDAMFAPVDPLCQLAKQKGYKFDDDCSDELLERIQRGLLVSPFTPKKIKKYCESVFDFD